MTEMTTVVVVGAGVAGLALGNLLQQQGIDCTILELQSRAYVEQRQRAGVIEYRMAKLFEEWGMADTVLQDARVNGDLVIRVHGRPRTLPLADFTGGRRAPMLPQQLLVKRLIDAFLTAGGDLRFDAADFTRSDLATEKPRVMYVDAASRQREIACEYVAGCDGSHGVSRASMPAGSCTEYRHDPGLNWLTVMTEAPPPPHPLFVVSDRGFAAGFARGPHASRWYLQCQPDDEPGQWPDARIWDELRARTGDGSLPGGPITEKGLVDLRSFVVEPMSYSRLFLAGDAAHVVAPLGAKGANLALHDAFVLAEALSAALKGDNGPLQAYSDSCLPRVWTYQAFSCWLSEMLHNAGGGTTVEPFRVQVARAQLDRLFTSPAAAAAFAELQVGVY